MFDYSKLRGKIREVCHTEQKFASSLGVTPITLSSKLNGKMQFSQNEIAKAMAILELPPESINEYFFSEKVKTS